MVGTSNQSEIPSLPDGSTFLEELFARGLRGAERHVSEIDRAVKEVSLAPDVPVKKWVIYHLVI